MSKERSGLRISAFTKKAALGRMIPGAADFDGFENNIWKMIFKNNSTRNSLHKIIM